MTPRRTEEVEPPVGFAGLSSMVSDVDALLSAARREIVPPSPPIVQKASPIPTSSSGTERPETPLRPAGTSAWSLPFGWAFGALMLFVFGTMIYSEATKSSLSIPSTSPQSPAKAPTHRAPPTPVPEPSSSYAEEKPPIGKGQILTGVQIQYCLAENIRLEAAQSMAHDTDDIRAVRRFNDHVDDYNNRCANFRYHRSVMETAKHAVEQRRSALENEGVQRFHATNPQSRHSASPPSNHQVIPRETRVPSASPPPERKDEWLSSDADQNATAADRSNAGQQSDTAALASPLTSSAITPPVPIHTARDLEGCLEGRLPAPCKQKMVNSSEPDRTEAAERNRNLKECLDGRYPTLCNHSLLTHSENEEVAAAEQRANLKRCLTGESPLLCNHQLLTPTQAQEVEDTERRVIFDICMEGRYPALCNEAILTPAQRQAIRTARAQQGAATN